MVQLHQRYNMYHWSRYMLCCMLQCVTWLLLTKAQELGVPEAIQGTQERLL